MRLTLFAVAALAAVPAVAAPPASPRLLVDGTGYTGPVLDLTAFDRVTVRSVGPIALPGGIVFTSTTAQSAIGSDNNFLVDNGFVTTPVISSNSPFDTVTLTFASPVAAFGAGMSYSLDLGRVDGDPPVISAFDASGALISRYDLEALAPINSGGANDFLLFRGIDGGGRLIKSFTMSGSFIVLSGTVNAIPEPTSWAMLIAGFGLTGAVMRRRRIAIA